MIIVKFIVGVIFLIVGAEGLVRGASRLATSFGISPLVVGLTVVALGTSSPELAVNLNAALSGQAGIALGSVIGSNIFNVLLILGISAMIIPLTVSEQLIRLDVPLMIGLSVTVFLMGLDGEIGRFDGLILLTAVVSYTAYLIIQSRREEAAKEAAQPSDAEEEPSSSWYVNVGMLVGGFALLVLGSRWLVEGAVTFATFLGVSELIIGLTIVAAGTSLPEVVTSIIAAFRGERDIAVGNAVGSNIFNLTAVIGTASVVSPVGIEVSPAIIQFDFPILMAVAFACLPIFFTEGTISRWEGALFFGYYLAYTTYLILAATEHDALTGFSWVMLSFVAPLTAITIIVIALQELRHRMKAPVEA
ncbi:MAG: calcium/sodium antiporter [Chloroflexota bacterium]